MDRNRTDDRIGVGVENLPNGHYKYTLPIPLSEIVILIYNKIMVINPKVSLF